MSSREKFQTLENNAELAASSLLYYLPYVLLLPMCFGQSVHGIKSKKAKKKEQRPEKCSKITLGNIVALSALVIQMMDESYEPETGSVVSVECEQAAQSSAAVGRKERRAHIFKELFYSLCDIYAWSWHSFFATIIITLNCFSSKLSLMSRSAVRHVNFSSFFEIFLTPPRHPAHIKQSRANN